jgi:hypothetical protein
MDWQRIFDSSHFRTLQGDGFSLRTASPPEGIVIRYSEGDRELTLLAPLEDETEKYGRWWFLFPNVTAVLRIPNLLKWDNGERMTQVEESRALDRIRMRISKRGRFRVMVDDEFYLAMQRDLDKNS